MLVMTLMQLISKCMTCSLLVTGGRKRLLAFMIGAELITYFLYKLAMRDFRSYLPLKGWASLLCSIIFRTAEKIMGDFTGLVYLRHPNYMGGFYWLFNGFYTQIGLFVVIVIRTQHDKSMLESSDPNYMPLRLEEEVRSEFSGASEAGGTKTRSEARVFLLF